MYALMFSNGKNYGKSYLEHIVPVLPELLKKAGKSANGACRAIFIPWAGSNFDEMLDYTQQQFSVFKNWTIESIHQLDPETIDLAKYDLILVNGGNTFRLVKKLQETHLMEKIAEAVKSEKCCYAGWSAGANIAAPTLSTTNDMPICWPSSPECLKLIPFQICPHYLDENPDSHHGGETQEERLIQHQEEEHAYPVVALREGTWLELIGDAADSQSYALCGEPIRHDFMQIQPAYARWFKATDIQELNSTEDLRAVIAGLM